MRLTEILQPECVKVPLTATTRQAVIFELVDLLSDVTGIADREGLRDAVWKREQTRTTGIGHGIAIPHGKVAGCTRLCMAMGKTAQPIDFNAIDGQPVRVVFLLASRPDQTGPHIQALAQISHLLTDDGFRSALHQVTTAREIHDLIAEHETKSVT